VQFIVQAPHSARFLMVQGRDVFVHSREKSDSSSPGNKISEELVWLTSKEAQQALQLQQSDKTSKPLLLGQEGSEGTMRFTIPIFESQTANIDDYIKMKGK
jgi:hypothetical protein